MMGHPARTRTVAEILAEADARLHAGSAQWRTLDPDRARAHPLAWIGRTVVGDEDSEAAFAFADGLAAIAHAMRQAFPGNLFWDLDYLGASLWRLGGGDPAAIVAHASAVAAVQAVFGRDGAIGFAYVHDFVYGFDWAKWVARTPAERGGVEPLSAQFVAVMQARGEELVTLLDQGGDERYPPLPGNGPRNPFGFSRAPADEIILHRHLAKHGDVPVAAWSVDAVPDATRPYGELRRRAAARLGLSR